MEKLIITVTVDSTMSYPGNPNMPPIEDLFTVDEIGGWDALNEELFSDNGIATQAIAAG